MNTYSICDSSLQRSARRSFAPLSILRQNHRFYVWTVALPGMVFVPAQKLSGSIVWTPIRYVILQFRDRSGAASPCYRNRAEITVLHMCEQKPVLCRNHRSCVWTETLSGMVFVLVQKPSSRTLIVGYVSLRASSPFLASKASCERTREREAKALASFACRSSVTSREFFKSGELARRLGTCARVISNFTCSFI